MISREGLYAVVAFWIAVSGFIVLLAVAPVVLVALAIALLAAWLSWIVYMVWDQL